jgi:hypothetical protein
LSAKKEGNEPTDGLDVAIRTLSNPNTGTGANKARIKIKYRVAAKLFE